jgi:cell division protein FtsB
LFRALKNRLRAIAPSAVLLVITGYFCWSAVHGKSGLEAQTAERTQLAQAQQTFALADAQRAQWETRIADLSGQSIARDVLDAEARQVLNLADPNDLVVDLTKNPSPK